MVFIECQCKLGCPLILGVIVWYYAFFSRIKWQHRMADKNINEIIIAKRDRCECSDATIEIKVKTLDSQTYTLRVDKCVSIFISWSSMLLILFGVKNGWVHNNFEVFRLQILIFYYDFYDSIQKRKVQSGGNIRILYFCTYLFLYLTSRCSPHDIITFSLLLKTLSFYFFKFCSFKSDLACIMRFYNFFSHHQLTFKV